MNQSKVELLLNIKWASLPFLTTKSLLRELLYRLNKEHNVIISRKGTALDYTLLIGKASSVTRWLD